MIISDLNYLEAVEGSDVAGGRGKKYDIKFTKKLKADIKVDVKIKPEVSTKDIKGNVALGSLEVEAKGNNSFTDGEVELYASGNKSYTKIFGIAAVN